jgi:RNA polymerase sigma-70 factor (ECF subfamily)
VAAADVPDPRAPWSAAAQDHDTRETEERAVDLRRLFDDNYASVWRLLRRFGVPARHLDDAAQDVFWVAARRLESIRPGSERAFLYGVALRIAADRARQRRAQPALADPEELFRVEDPAPSPEEHLETRQARVLLDAALDRLPLELRAAFVLAELEGFEVRQIAELEGIPVGTAASRLRRAREEFSAIARRMRAALGARTGAR